MNKVNFKAFLPMLSFCIMLSVVGCSGNDANTIKTLQAANDDLQTNLNESNQKYTELESTYNDLKTEYNDYKESMKVYEDLSEAEAEAEIVKNEQIVADAKAEAAEEKEKAEKEAAEKEAKAKAEAEEKEKKGYETGITYKQLARTPDDYIGEKVKFTGTVIQVIEGTDEVQIRFAVNDDYDNMLYCGYDSSITSERVLEDDNITIYGQSLGLITYQSTLGGDITIPAISVDKLKIN